MAGFFDRWRQVEPREVLTLAVAGLDENITLTSHDFSQAAKGKIWERKSPEEFTGEGLVLMRLKCTAAQEFALTKQYQDADGSVRMEADVFCWDNEHQRLYPKAVRQKYLEGVAETKRYLMLDRVLEEETLAQPEKEESAS